MSDEKDRDLFEFQHALRKEYGAHVTFQLSFDLQEIVDRYHLSLNDLCSDKQLRIPHYIMVGGITAFLPNKSEFYNSVATAESLINRADGQLCFVHCLDTRNRLIPTVIVFPQKCEMAYVERLDRLCRLRAFL